MLGIGVDVGVIPQGADLILLPSPIVNSISSTVGTATMNEDRFHYLNLSFSGGDLSRPMLPLFKLVTLSPVSPFPLTKGRGRFIKRGLCPLLNLFMYEENGSGRRLGLLLSYYVWKQELH